MRRTVRTVRRVVEAPAASSASNLPIETMRAKEPGPAESPSPSPSSPRYEVIEEYEYEDEPAWLLGVSRSTGKGVSVLKLVLLLVAAYLIYRVL
jgi:hypothetical protein